MNWYIGQEVVCVRSSPSTIKKGCLYTIYGLRQGCCGVEIYVGFNNAYASFDNLRCPRCHSSYKQDGKQWYFEDRFAPLMGISELESILNTKQQEA